MTRRKWFGLLPVVAGAPLMGDTPKPAVDILKSFDAREWAHEFVRYVKLNPAIATDEDVMATWFANSLMRGYDEHAHRQTSPPPPFPWAYSRESLRGAVARGWCHPKNSHKVFDNHLADAVVDELMKLA
jgi:hypothetical protein